MPTKREPATKKCQLLSACFMSLTPILLHYSSCSHHKPHTLTKSLRQPSAQISDCFSPWVFFNGVINKQQGTGNEPGRAGLGQGTQGTPFLGWPAVDLHSLELRAIPLELLSRLVRSPGCRGSPKPDPKGKAVQTVWVTVGTRLLCLITSDNSVWI